MRRSVTIVALCVSPRSQMDSAKSPSDIARETLKLLAKRRLTPSPDNYQALYEEVAGTRSAPQFPATQLRQILRVMPCQTPGQKRQAELLEKAIAQQDWSMLQNVLVGYAKLGLAPAPVPPVPVPLAGPATLTADGPPRAVPGEAPVHSGTGKTPPASMSWPRSSLPLCASPPPP